MWLVNRWATLGRGKPVDALREWEGPNLVGDGDGDDDAEYGGYGCRSVNFDMWYKLIEDTHDAMRSMCFCDYERTLGSGSGSCSMEVYAWEALLRIEVLNTPSLLRSREALMEQAASEVPRRVAIVARVNARSSVLRQLASDWQAATEAGDAAKLKKMAADYPGLDEPVVLQESYGLNCLGPHITAYDPRDPAAAAPARLRHRLNAFRDAALTIYRTVAACGIPAAAESAATAIEDLGKVDGAWCSGSASTGTFSDSESESEFLSREAARRASENVVTQWLQNLEKRLVVPDAALEAHVAAYVAKCVPTPPPPSPAST